MPQNSLRESLSSIRYQAGRLLVGVALGLYLSRLFTESFAVAWRVRAVILLSLGCCILSSTLMVLGRRLRLSTWPLGLFAIYVCWPSATSMLAWALLLLVTCVFLAVNSRHDVGGTWLEITVCLASFTLYLATLAPTLLPADSGEFQLVSYVLGIAHPPGYPLYTLLGKLFTFLPLGDVAYRLNLLSAVLGAATLGILARAVRQGTGSWIAALIAATALGLSATFWAQSTTANIRSLTALFTALALALLLQWDVKRSSPNYLAALGLCLGLGVGHHSSFGLLLFPFGAYLLVCDPHMLRQPRRWLPMLGAFLASFLVLLYLPLRSLTGAPFDPAPIRSWKAFISHVLALGFRGDMFYFRSLPELLPRLSIWSHIMQLEFGHVILGATLGAALLLGLRRWRVLLLLGGVWTINGLSAITYRAPQTVEYLLPSYVALAMTLGYGLGILLRTRSCRPLVGALVGGLLVAASQNGVANYPSFRILHNDTSARDYAQAILQDAPQGALVLSNWHRATTFWYLQYVEGLRPDVEVRYVYPQGSQPNEEIWLKHIAEALPHRPVIVTNRYYAFEQTRFRWIPFHGAWLVHDGPLRSLPLQLDGMEADFEGEIRVLGYQVEDRDLIPGETLRVRIYWQPTRRLDRDYSSFVQLVGPQGVVGQGDIVHRSSEYAPGELRIDDYSFPLLLHTPPGDYELITGFYYDTGSGLKRLSTQKADHLRLSYVRVQLGREDTVTLHPLAQSFANGLILTGVDFDRSVPGQLRLYLHWKRPAPVFPIALVCYSPKVEDAFIRLAQRDMPIAQDKVPPLQPGHHAMTALDLPADVKSLTLSMFNSEGQLVPGLGPWHLPTTKALTLKLPHGETHFVPLGGEMAFIGLRSPQAARAGATLWLRPRFLALRPLVADYSVAVGLKGQEPPWEQKADSTPALGAIPTLKWLRGWIIEDPHQLMIPTHVPPGQATITLEVYDAFTLKPLQVLDERLVAAGQGTRVDVRKLTITP